MKQILPLLWPRDLCKQQMAFIKRYMKLNLGWNFLTQSWEEIKHRIFGYLTLKMCHIWAVWPCLDSKIEKASSHFSPGLWKGPHIDSWDPQLHYRHAIVRCSITIGHRNSISNTKTEVMESTWITLWFYTKLNFYFEAFRQHWLITDHLIFVFIYLFFLDLEILRD